MGSLWSTAWSEAREIVVSTSAHGIGRAVSGERRSTRVMWTLLFVLATGGFGLHLSRLTEHYLQYPISTTVSYKSAEFQFPDVTICNLLPLSLRKLELKDPGFERLLSLRMLAEQERESGLSDLLNGTENDKFSMLLVCTYNLRVCGPQNFTEFEDPLFRTCFTFSPQEEIASNSAERGLNLVVYAENYHGHVIPDISFAVPENWDASGVKLVIHERGTHAHPELKGVNVQAGVHAQFAVSMEEFELLYVFRDGEWRCDGDERLVAYCVLDSHGTPRALKETTEDCYTAVLQRLTVDRCGCLSPEQDIPSDYCATPLNDSHFCHRENQCYAKLKLELNANYEQLVVRKCKPTCRQVSYSKQISTSDWPSHVAETRVLNIIQQRYRDLLLENVHTTLDEVINASSDSSALIKNNFLRITVYPEALTADLIHEELAYPMVSFVSEVGGILGLWMGASILTFLEPLQLLVNLLTNACTRRRVSAKAPAPAPTVACDRKDNVELRLNIDDAP